MIILMITIIGGSAHGDGGLFGKIMDWEPERELICYPAIGEPLVEADSDFIYIVYGVNILSRYTYEIHSSDGGNTWSDPYNVFESAVIGAKAMALEDGNLHVIDLAVEQPIAGLAYRQTTDGGYSWSEIQTLRTDACYGRISICAENNKVFCTYNNHNTDIMLLRSFDNGHTWEQPLRIRENGGLIQPPYMAYSEGIWHFAFAERSHPDWGREIYYTRSSENGDSWSEPFMLSSNDARHSQWVNLAAGDNGIIAITWMDYKYGSLFRMWGEIICRISIDNGLNWGPEIRITNDTCACVSDVSVEGESIYVTYDYRYTPGIITDIFLRYSSDSGTNWGEIERVSNHTRSSLTTSIAVSQPPSHPDTDMIHIVWQEGIPEDSQECLYYRQKIQEITGIEDDIPLLPTQTGILQNYPNPFNASTTIKYQLADDSDVQLIIYNLLGEKVTNLVDERQDGGEHEITWDASAFSNGIYFCKLTTGEKTFTKRMVLLR
jgi:hypothetical protein